MSDATTNLMTSWEEHEEDLGNGHRVVRISISGEPHVTAILAAVVDNYHRLTYREQPTEEFIRAQMGQKVTLIETGENMLGANLLVAREGTLFESSRGIGILPKRSRTKGFRVDPDRVLDIFPGYQTAKAQMLVDQARAHYPKVKELTQERLEQLPIASHMLGLCLFGTYRMPDSTATDTLILAGEYNPDDDIVDMGVILIRPEHGVSEHGSFFGRDLLRVHKLGEVVGYEPISFKAAVDLCDLDFDEAYASVMSGLVAVA